MRLMFGLSLAITIAAGSTIVVQAKEYYKVTVTRVEKDLYRTDGTRKIYIETKYCYEYATREEAILKWEGRYGDNKLIFDSGTSCDVKELR